MKQAWTLCCLVAGLLFHPIADGQAPSTGRYVPNARALANAKAVSRLSSGVKTWLPAAAECQGLVEELVKDPDNEVRFSLVAAQVSVLTGKPTTAIGILDNLIARNPHKSTPGYTNVPVVATACLWRGTIARYHGDFAVARDSYKRVLAMRMEGATSAPALHALANLYSAEIDQALERPAKERMARLKLVADSGVPHYSAWASYLQEVQGTNAKQAQRKLKWDADQSAMVPMVCVLHMGLSCMFDEGGVTFSGGNELRNCLLGLAAENRPSKIDRTMASLVLGFGAYRHGKYGAAVPHFQRIFESDSFFAPEAGINLLRVLKKLENEKKFREVAESLTQRFPGYAEAVKGL